MCRFFRAVIGNETPESAARRCGMPRKCILKSFRRPTHLAADPERAGVMSRRLFVALTASALVLSASVMLFRTDERDAFLIGDCPYYAATAQSLLQDGDLDLANQLGSDPDSLRAHAGFFAVGPDGAIVPKHSTLMPLLSVPFLAAFGSFGFLVFNVVQLGLLVYGIAVLAGDTPTARIVALIGYFLTPLMAYTFNYSPDVLGAGLVVWAYAAADRGRWVWCGLLAGLAVWAKVYLVLVLLPVAILVRPGCRRAVLPALAAAAIAVAPMLAINTALYGGPLKTGYDFEGRVTETGRLITIEHYSQFNQPVLTGLKNLMFDRRIGALWTAPLWFLWPVGVCLSVRAGGAERRLGLALGLAILANVLLFASYNDWAAAVGGNRFLFPAFALGLAAQEPVWRRILARFRSRPEVTH